MMMIEQFPDAYGRVARLSRSLRKGPPQVPELPWLGSGLSFTRRPVSFLAAAHDSLDSNIVRFGYFGKRLYSVRGQAATEDFFASPNLDLTGGFIEIFSGLLPERFLGEPDAELYTFSKKKAVFSFSTYLDHVRKSTDEVLRELGSSGTIDVFDLASELSFRASSRFMLGETALSPGFYRRWRELFFATNPVEALGRFQWNMLNPLFWKRQGELFDDMQRVLAQIVDAKGELEPGSEASFLDVGLTSIYPTKSKEKALGHLYMMFLAAYLNPTLTFGWVLTDLLRQDRLNPWRARVEAEVADAYRKHPDGPLPRPVLDGFENLQLNAMETLRLRIHAVNIRKVLGEPFVCAGVEIPEGAIVCNSPTFAHLSESNYEAPLEFRPERWLGSPELERGSMTARYMPFGTFAHICPGKRFSYVWLKIAIAELLHRFDLEIEGPIPKVREGIMPVLADRDGPCTLRFRRRVSDLK